MSEAITRVLVVDDEPSVCEFLSLFLRNEGYAVEISTDVASSVSKLATESFDLVMIDKNLPDGSGLEIARYISDKSLPCETIMMTAYGNLQSAVEAMRLKVADYLRKPFPDLDVIRACIERVTRQLELRRQNVTLKSELEEQREQLKSMAVRDSLTGLYNHVILHENLAREVVRSQRHKLQFGLLLIDIDGFDDVNQRYGHEAGNQLLCDVATMLRTDSRESDTAFRLHPDEVAARFGADVFAIILPETPRTDAIAKAESLRRDIADHSFSVIENKISVSIGIAGYPDDADNKKGLVASARVALERAKEAGRNRVVGYDSCLSTMGPRGGATIHDDLQAALERSIREMAFDFIYQPIVHADSQKAYGFEALCRPRHPLFPSPPKLIQTAERTGRIQELGRALRNCATQEIRMLPERATLFINIHPHELHDPALLAIEAFLAPWAERIVFEITEVARIRDHERTRELVDRLRAPGFRIALDDLGSGYSGLTSLAHLEPEYVKLDVAMVHDVATDSRARRLVRHILEFANDEGMKVVAEGIETREQMHVMRDMGCPLLQGFYFGKGVAAAEVRMSSNGPARSQRR